MKYICRICGYVYDDAKEKVPFEQLPDDWKCPLCGAMKKDFVPESVTADTTSLQVETDLKPLNEGQLAMVCSNLARGCEKQYLPQQAEDFRTLAAFFRSKAEPVQEASTAKLLELIENDLSVGYPYGNAVSAEKPDRGALRCQVWSEKVTRMLQSLLTRYKTEGEKMLENTGVWVCTVCGFVYVGNAAPDLCPVCKVPSWKFEKVEGRA